MASVIRSEPETTGDDDVLVIVDCDGGLPRRLDVGFVVQSSGRVGAVVTAESQLEWVALSSTYLMRTVSIIVNP